MGYYVFEYSAGTSLFLHMATHKREASPPDASLFLFSAQEPSSVCSVGTYSMCTVEPTLLCTFFCRFFVW